MANNQFYEVMFEKKVIDMREIYKLKEDDKFKGKIFCPECGMAKVFIRGSKKQKVIVDTEMSVHAKTCSYNYNQINVKQAKMVFNEMNDYKIDAALKEAFKLRVISKLGVGNIPIQIEESNKNGIKKRIVGLSMKNVENIDSSDCRAPSIFYGTCKVELTKNQRGYMIKLLAIKSGFQYFSINVSQTAFDHFPKSVKNVLSNPIRPMNFMYYGVLTEDKKKWKSTTLKNTNCLITGAGEVEVKDVKRISNYQR